MNEKVYALKDINGEQNFALATLCKQKVCLQHWLKYLNVKNIYMPEEVEKYRKRIAEINNAIKILEDELASPQSDLSEKNLNTRRTKQAIPATKKNNHKKSKINSDIDTANLSIRLIQKPQNRQKQGYTDN